jgi:putative oxidoreductase
MPVIHRVGKLYTSASQLLNHLQSPLLLAIRLYWGWQFAQSGWGKLHNIARVTDFFTSLGLPQPHLTAIAISLLELVGGILLAFGIGTRLISVVLFINMNVAYWTAEPAAYGKILSDPDKFTGADAYTFWFATLIIMVFGPGKWALDTILGRFFGVESGDTRSV